MSHHANDAHLHRALVASTGLRLPLVITDGREAPPPAKAEKRTPPADSASDSLGSAIERPLPPARGPVNEVRLEVEGIHCPACRAVIREGVGHVPGVADVDVDSSAATVVARGLRLNADAVRNALGEAGYGIVGPA